MTVYVFYMCLALCVIHSTLVAASNIRHSSWVPVLVDMNTFLKHASLVSTTNSEVSCTSLAMRKSAALYCFQPHKCYLPSGVTAFMAGETTGGWICKSTKKRKYVDAL